MDAANLMMVGQESAQESARGTVPYFGRQNLDQSFVTQYQMPILLSCDTFRIILNK